MNDILTALVALQDLEFGNKKLAPAKQATADELRKKIPAPILGHYERLMARGKKGIAIVKNGVCTGCYMRLATGAMGTLLRREDVQLCDTCGRYLYLPHEPAPAPEAAPPAKPAARRKGKTPASAA